MIQRPNVKYFAIGIVVFIVGPSMLLFQKQSEMKIMRHHALAQPTPNLSQSAQPAQSLDPPGTINGATNPELISDFKAYEVFFHSVVVSETEPEVKKAEAKSKFSRAKLDDKDTAALMKILGEFYRDRSNLNVRFNQLRSEAANENEFVKLDKEANDLINSTQAKLSKRLSKEGVEKLQAHIMGLKAKIKLLPQPQT